MRSIGLAVALAGMATPCFAGFVWAPTPGGVVGHTTSSPNVSQSQSGSDNLSVVTQAPGCTGGHVVTRQNGAGNVAVVDQCGAGNSAVIVQGGSGNSSSIVMN